jgi:ABC-2 type transport system permease protein
MRTLRIYLALFAQMLKVRLAHRGDFFADLFATALGGLASVLFVLLFFVPVESIHDWTRDQVLLVVGLQMSCYGIFATVSWNLFEFGDRYVIEGRFDRVLLRPVSTWAQVLCDQFRIPVLSESAIGLAVVVHSARKLGLSFTALDVGFAAVTIASGTAIYVFVFSILASLSFHFEDRVGVAPPVFNLIQVGRWPQEIFPTPLRLFLRWVIPFGFVAFYPAQRLLGGGAFRELALVTPLVALGFGLLHVGTWRLGVRRYESTGS